MVKVSRLTVDPDWLSVIRTPLSESTRDKIQQSIIRFFAIADSYRYYDDDGDELDPVWEYTHPRSDCDHSQSEKRPPICDPNDVVSEQDAKDLIRYIEEGKVGVMWQREDAGRN